MFGFRGRQTQFYLDLVYGLAFSLGFGYLLFVGMDPRVAAFEGGLVFGYFLRVWENMTVYERVLEAEVAEEAEAVVATEVAERVPAEAEAQVQEEVEEQVQAEVEAEVEDQVQEEVEEQVTDEMADLDEQIDERVDERIEEADDVRRDRSEGSPP